MLKKILSVILSFIVLAGMCLYPVSAADKKLRFNEDGTFRILQINDFQHRDNTNSDSVEFLNAVLDKYRPDLVVLAGMSDFLMLLLKLTILTNLKKLSQN